MMSTLLSAALILTISSLATGADADDVFLLALGMASPESSEDSSAASPSSFWRCLLGILLLAWLAKKIAVSLFPSAMFVFSLPPFWRETQKWRQIRKAERWTRRVKMPQTLTYFLKLPFKHCGNILVKFNDRPTSQSNSSEGPSSPLPFSSALKRSHINPQILCPFPFTGRTNYS